MIAIDGKGAYREAMVETCGEVPARKPGGKGLTPEKKQPQPGCHYLQVVKRREGSRCSLTNILPGARCGD
ncbi:MAG: hypothetical protein J2P21_07160 [Chloracidobacterium sp.]|nr:hypothetical protein [Chloracidobacterium sp.]